MLPHFGDLYLILPVLSDNKDGGAAMCGGHQLQGAQFSYIDMWMKTIYLQSGNFS